MEFGTLVVINYTKTPNFIPGKRFVYQISSSNYLFKIYHAYSPNGSRQLTKEHSVISITKIIEQNKANLNSGIPIYFTILIPHPRISTAVF